MKLANMTAMELFATRNDIMHELRRSEDKVNYMPSQYKRCRCSEINPDPVYSCHIPCDLCAAKRDIREWADLLTEVNRHIRARVNAV